MRQNDSAKFESKVALDAPLEPGHSAGETTAGAGLEDARPGDDGRQGVVDRGTERVSSEDLSADTSDQIYLRSARLIRRPKRTAMIDLSRF